MNLAALMQAASNDPQAAAFIQQLLAGGTPTAQRLPEIQSMVGTPPPELMPFDEPAPLPVFDDAKASMDKLLGQWAPPAAPPSADPAVTPPAAGAAAPADLLGQMATPEPIAQQTIGYSPEQQAAGQAPPQNMTDLLAMLRGYVS